MIRFKKEDDEFDRIFKDSLIFIFIVFTLPIYVLLQVVLAFPIKTFTKIKKKINYGKWRIR